MCAPLCKGATTICIRIVFIMSTHRYNYSSINCQGYNNESGIFV